MRRALAISVGLHAALGGALILGLPQLSAERLEIGRPIPVEMVDASLLEPEPVPPRPAEPLPEPAPEQAARSTPVAQSAPPPAASPAPPPSPPPSPPPVRSEQPLIAPPPETPPAQPQAQPDPAPTRTESETALIAPPPAGKPRAPETSAAEPEPEVVAKDDPDAAAFDARALVVDLTPRERSVAPPPQPVAGRTSSAEIAEMQAVIKAAIERHWMINAGAAAARELIVDVRITMNPDRTLRRADIVDQARYRSDPAFRAAADNALRAVRMASPLPVRPEMFDYWKEITFRFDPSQKL